MKHYEKAFYQISGHSRGWSFSANDFITVYTRDRIDEQLKYLAKIGKIRRICRGIYDYPKYSELLKQYLSPDIDQVAYAYSRKFNWRIEISGESALNPLGLSTQVPGRYLYLSDGPNRSYDIMGTILEFKKSVLKDIGFKHKESSLIVQALKALGKERISENIIAQIRSKIDAKLFKTILKDTSTSTGWIYDAIKQICQED